MNKGEMVYELTNSKVGVLDITSVEVGGELQAHIVVSPKSIHGFVSGSQRRWITDDASPANFRLILQCIMYWISRMPESLKDSESQFIENGGVINDLK